MDYIDYKIKQVGKTLTADKIKINKFDNKVSRLLFELDGTIPGRLYLAMKNPVTKKYFYSLLTDNAVTIGTVVSMYVGRWDVILMGVSEDYDLDELEDIDQTKITYVSDTLKKIVVIDNFLDDDCEVFSLPALDDALDKFARNREELENNLLQTGADVTACEETLASCREVLEECQDVLADCQELYDEMSAINTSLKSLQSRLTATYNTYSSNLNSQYERYKMELENLIEEVGS